MLVLQAQMASGDMTQEEIAKAQATQAATMEAAQEGFKASQEHSGVQLQLQELMRKAPQASKMCQMLDRPMLGFEVRERGLPP